MGLAASSLLLPAAAKELEAYGVWTCATGICCLLRGGDRDSIILANFGVWLVLSIKKNSAGGEYFLIIKLVFTPRMYRSWIKGRGPLHGGPMQCNWPPPPQTTTTSKPIVKFKETWKTTSRRLYQFVLWVRSTICSYTALTFHSEYDFSPR